MLLREEGLNARFARDLGFPGWVPGAAGREVSNVSVVSDGYETGMRGW